VGLLVFNPLCNRDTQKSSIGGLSQRITDGKDKNRTKKLGRIKKGLKENEEER
jgi:hypothetical protein